MREVEQTSAPKLSATCPALCVKKGWRVKRAGAIETTETSGVWTARSGVARPTTGVARYKGEANFERHAGSQLVASSGVSTKKAQAFELGFVS